MRRCPRCQSPNPDHAERCSACSAALPALLRKPWISLGDVYDVQALERVALGLVPLLLFGLSFGRLLTVGSLRQEWRFAVFHLAHGLILAAGLAWAWRERRAKGWALWLAAGLAGGLLTEALESWYTYRGLMGFFSVAAWQWFGFPDDNALIYEILQVLRLLGAAFALLAAYAFRERRAARRVLARFWIALAVALRSQVRGAWVAWGALGGAMAWLQLGLYALSALSLAWGLGPRGLTRDP